MGLVLSIFIQSRGPKMKKGDFNRSLISGKHLKIIKWELTTVVIKMIAINELTKKEIYCKQLISISNI